MADLRSNPPQKPGVQKYLHKRRRDLAQRQLALDLLETELSDAWESFESAKASHEWSAEQDGDRILAYSTVRPDRLRGLGATVAAACRQSLVFGSVVGATTTVFDRVMKAAGAVTQDERRAFYEGWEIIPSEVLGAEPAAPVHPEELYPISAGLAFRLGASMCEQADSESPTPPSWAVFKRLAGPDPAAELACAFVIGWCSADGWDPLEIDIPYDVSRDKLRELVAWDWPTMKAA